MDSADQAEYTVASQQVFFVTHEGMMLVCALVHTSALRKAVCPFHPQSSLFFLLSAVLSPFSGPILLSSSH